jgi:hypothetical protein
LARDGDDFGEFTRRLQGMKQSLLVVQTTCNQVFGAYVESTWSVTEGFYGLGQACLYKVVSEHEIQVYKWTGVNRYIQTCSHDRIGLGGGGDFFGLCLQQNFSVGSTGPCDTFGNEPLCSDENFHVANMEVYGFLLGQF